MEEERNLGIVEDFRLISSNGLYARTAGALQINSGLSEGNETGINVVLGSP